MKRKHIKPIEYDENYNITFNLTGDATNDDWLHALRLLKQAMAGDEKAQQEFDRLSEKNISSTIMHNISYLIKAPRCFQRHCKHYQGIAPPDGIELTGRPVCKAYPNGIPDEIAYGNDLHHTVRDDQDNDITFKRK